MPVARQAGRRTGLALQLENLVGRGTVRAELLRGNEAAVTVRPLTM